MYTPTDTDNNVDIFVKNILNLRFDIQIEIFVDVK